MHDVLNLIGRSATIFEADILQHDQVMRDIVERSSFLVIGAAGTIGQAVTREIFKRNPKTLHAVDISENNLVELVRDIRSTLGYIDGDFRTFAIDAGSVEFAALLKSGHHYDYILNLSALKHVRSEKDPFSLMRMIQVNILNTIDTIAASPRNLKKYFCVSTDKAANPVNLMGASKRIMELFLMRDGQTIPISTARFANVAFSDGSLLHGFNQRLSKRQPISAPNDVRRYFVTPQESGELCLMSCLLGKNRDIFFPKLSEDLHLITFAEIAERYLRQHGYEPVICETEEEARQKSALLIQERKWPCYFFKSDTTGEKDFEEFFTLSEKLDLDRFMGIGVIENSAGSDEAALTMFLNTISNLRLLGSWNKQDIVSSITKLLPNLVHKETGKYLDDRM